MAPESALIIGMILLVISSWYYSTTPLERHQKYQTAHAAVPAARGEPAPRPPYSTDLPARPEWPVLLAYSMPDSDSKGPAFPREGGRPVQARHVRSTAPAQARPAHRRLLAAGFNLS